MLHTLVLSMFPKLERVYTLRTNVVHQLLNVNHWQYSREFFTSLRMQIHIHVTCLDIALNGQLSTLGSPYQSLCAALDSLPAYIIHLN